MGFLQARSLLLRKFGIHPGLDETVDFLLVDVVEGNVHVTDKVVTLLSGGLRRGAAADLLPGKHGLADVDAAVVDKGGLDHVVAACLEQSRDRVPKQVVADVSQMQGLVGVGRGELHHDVLPRGGKHAEILCKCDFAEQLIPVKVREKDIQEPLDAVVAGDLRDIGDQPVPYRRTGLLGCGSREPQQREYYEGEVTFELFPGN